MNATSELSMVQKLELVWDHRTDEATQLALAADSDARIRVQMAGDVHRPVSVWERLSEDENEEVRRAVARWCDNTRVLNNLTYDDSETVCASVASNQHIPPTSELSLMVSESVMVRAALAGNPYVTQSVVSRLAFDENTKVRVAVAGSPAANDETLTNLSRDSLVTVRKAVARNRYVDRDVLEVLSNDGNEGVRRDAHLRLTSNFIQSRPDDADNYDPSPYDPWTFANP